MSNKTEFVDYEESLSVKVGRFLLSKGFDLASSIGYGSPSEVEDRSLGILHKDAEVKPHKYLFGLITQEPRRGFLGVVWFNNSAHGAGGRNWVFEVYGRKHLELAGQLAEEMASTFNTKITVRLTSEQPKVELNMSYVYESYCVGRF